MKFEAKLSAALERLATTGIRRGNFSPPMHRLLWRLGVQIPPPHFASFTANFLLAGVWFGLAWGALMWFFRWESQSMPLANALGTAALAGILFGLSMAFYYRYGARKNALPSWKNFAPSSEVRSTQQGAPADGPAPRGRG